jgi:hypothetical protein
MDLLANSNFTGSVAKAGLTIGGTSTKIKIAAPNGAGVDFAIDGIGYHKADTDNIAVTAHAAQADDTTCLYLVQIDSDGTVSTKKGNEVLTADLGITNSCQWPSPDADNCPIGGYKVVTDGGTFTNGTTALDDGTITDTYIDFLMGMPGKPQTS